MRESKMSDAALRRAERAWRASPSPETQAAYLATHRRAFGPSLLPARQQDAPRLVTMRLLWDPRICGDYECSACAILVCPFAEPLHFHRAGCPACDSPISTDIDLHPDGATIITAANART